MITQLKEQDNEKALIIRCFEKHNYTKRKNVKCKIFNLVKSFQPVGHRSILRWVTELFEKLDVWFKKVLFDLQKLVSHLKSIQ